MHRLMPLLLIPLFSITLQAQTLTFSREPVPEGTRVEVVDSVLLDLDYTVAKSGGDVAFHSPYRKQKEYTKTVLEVDDGRTQKYRLDFSKAYESKDWPRTDDREVYAPVTAAEYVVTRSNTESSSTNHGQERDARRVLVLPDWTIARADNRPMSAGEIGYLRDETRGGIEHSIGAILDGRTVAVGQAIDIADDALAQLNTDFIRGDVQPEDLRLELTEIEEKDGMRIANFDVTLRMDGSAGDLQLGADVKGILRVGENGWLHSLVLFGTLNGTGSHQATAVSADGTVEGTMMRTYAMN